MTENPSLGPLLNAISSPADLKALSAGELPQLAQEIRHYLVEAVSRTGGHLGPNLGVVELTMALHRVFDSPADTLIFDTGHQSYVHKLLTGRQDFSHLRQAGGVSGYPSRTESIHDVVENSHASTAISWADGISREYQRQGNPHHVVAVIGDGALTGGMAWEAINNLADDESRNVIIVVNDNGRSYAPTIGGLAQHLDALRTSPTYEKALAWGKKHLLSHGKPGELAFDALHGIKAGMRELVAPNAMFAELGLKYLGTVDGHDLPALETVLMRAKGLGGPVLVHVITEKGRGYVPAEEDVADRFHAVGVIHPETGLPLVPSRFGWTSVFADEIVKLAEEFPQVVGITAAMMAPVGLLPLAEKYPERVIDVGIAEQHAVTAAAGMAFAGAHPVFAVYATFLNRAFDQVLMDVALHKAGVTFVLDRAGVTGDDGASHNGMWDISLMSIVPGLELAAPRDEQTLRASLRRAVQVDDRPTLVRYPKGALPDPISALESAAYGDVLAGRSVGEAGEVVIVATGALAGTGLAVAQQLCAEFSEGALESKDFPQVTVIDPVWILPVKAELVDRLAKARLVVCLEDGLDSGGYAGCLREEMAKAKVFTPVVSFGVPKEFLPHATRGEIMSRIGLDAQAVTQKILDYLR
ncbi:1-deoxy-D-xylulose-5-phosphate synthase [Gleimia sp. 6138-11-ORH1]|uniref:1-deoxy-D-xylulose-5-phosphate synthase n=1 Tax=Gleimia sp. 6138-11-ORH1 TaxID=2973937 RepID=UPI002168E5E3|nr:1-deoxy-D-xylulose-5-phosphate synthase [Gleimia sp. 6138-11-ORH1]MCS4484422.1 1-deoxy-D-xylulose-5-phosphate synthase [Gleimia sp. 6138-11-ORH1]